VGSKRGFSSMDPQKQREIASKGGKAAHQKGTAHEFTTEEARIAGRKGGAASRARRSSGQKESDNDNGSEMGGEASLDRQTSEEQAHTATSEETSGEPGERMGSDTSGE